MLKHPLWPLVAQRLMQTHPDKVVAVKIENETAVWFCGGWSDESFAPLCPVHLTQDDIFPPNPDRENDEVQS